MVNEATFTYSMQVENVFALVGGLGIFLYGLQVMSAGLQKGVGDRIQNVLSIMTQNRVAGIFSGFFTTVLVQSSSATTVMIVSFANAGLMNLRQAISMVMGANIGTTVTLWLVALLGFKVKIDAFALPSIGIAVFLSFVGNRQLKLWSEPLLGFGLLFLGLSILKKGVPDLKGNPEALEFVTSLADYGFGSVLLFVLIGTVLTIVVQSSSAATTITVTFLAHGWITFDLAAAMILGENIGTTVTAQLAAIPANRTAKRVAVSHTLFNVLGVIWMLPLVGAFIVAIQSAFVTDSPTHLAIFHTTFNVLNTILLVWFLPQMERAVYKIMPRKQSEQG